MGVAKVAVTIQESTLKRLDQLVRQAAYPSRSRIVQEALEEKLSRIDRGRLARESAKLDRKEERELADMGLSEELSEWPAY